MVPLKKTTVYLSADDYRRLKALAREQDRSTADLIREAVSEYARRRSGPVVPSSLGRGHSGRSDLSEHAEELLQAIGSDD